jgi:hypothetical protein
MSGQSVTLPNINNNSNNGKKMQRRVSMDTEIFLTSKLNTSKRKSIHQYLNLNEYNAHQEEDYNVQLQIMQQFKKRKEKKVSNKLRQRKILDKLYGMTPKYLDRYQKVQRNKHLSLEKYQDNLLSFFSSQTNIDKRDFMDLKQGFDEIRENSISVNPLPPVNFSYIYDHVKHAEKNPKSDKMLSLKEFLSKNDNRVKDDWEREQDLIEKMKKIRIVPKKKRNRNLDLLPPHIREALNQQLKFHV